VTASAPAEREDGDRGDRCRRRERGAEANAAAAQPALRDWGRVQLGGQARVEPGEHAGGERLSSELGQRAAHGLQFLRRHVGPESAVVHDR
jgi:hypothetical protein